MKCECERKGVNGFVVRWRCVRFGWLWLWRLHCRHLDNWLVAKATGVFITQGASKESIEVCKPLDVNTNTIIQQTNQQQSAHQTSIMEWAEELFTLKKSAKKGRRAAAAASAASTPATVGGSGSSSSAGSAGADKPAADKPGSGTSITSIANSLEATDLNNGAAATAAAARPPRRTSGWSEETMAKASSKAGGVNNAIEQ